MNRQESIVHLLTVVLVFFLLISWFFHATYASSGNAEVSRVRNLQVFQMIPSHHPPGNASFMRKDNLQFFRMTPQMHPPGNALTARVKNLQFFKMAPAASLVVTINSFLTTDQDGNLKTSFSPGSTVLFESMIYGSGMQNIPNALVSVIAKNPNLTTVFLSYDYKNIESGQQTVVYMGLRLAYNCKIGDYTASVDVLTQLPSQGGQAVDGGHAELRFTVS